jgi:hypothetical protein
LRRKACQQSLARTLAACFGSAARPDLGNLLAMGRHHEPPIFLANFAQKPGTDVICFGGWDKFVHGEKSSELDYFLQLTIASRFAVPSNIARMP